MSDLDVPAAFGAHWSQAELVAEVEFRDRQIKVLRAGKENEEHPLGFVLCEVSKKGKLEGMVFLYKTSKGGKVEGSFFGAPDCIYVLRREPFRGDWPEVLALVQEVIAAAYDFPPELGMQAM